MQTAILVRPAFKYKKSFLQAMVEIQNEAATNSFSAGMFENKLNIATLQKDAEFKAFLQRINNNPERNTFWLVGNDERGEEIFIGRVRVRRKLREGAKSSLGHIGYLIRPSMRSSGYGSLILQLALLEAKKIVTDLAENHGKILVSCKSNNLYSRKIILNNGGVLEREVDLGGSGGEMLFWIKL